jgi:hypothetical protein
MTSRASASPGESLGLVPRPLLSSRRTAPRLDRTPPAAHPADLLCRGSSMPRGLLDGEPMRQLLSFLGELSAPGAPYSLPGTGVVPGLLHALPADRDLWLPGPRGSWGREAACRLSLRRYCPRRRGSSVRMRVLQALQQQGRGT